jgi:hypothetical protein
MRFKLFLTLLLMLSVNIGCFADKQNSSVQDQHLEVSMRMIGHQILLNSGDSTSRVLPIERDGNKYTTNFENEFEFHPDDLAAIIDSVIDATGIASEYIVQVLSCETD